MNILLYLFTLSYDIIKSIINIHYYIFKNIRKNYFDKYYKDHDVQNLFSLVIKIIFLSIYEFLVFHIYVFIFLIHDSSIKFGYFGIFLRFFLTISVSTILAFISEEIKHIFQYLFQLNISILHLFTWVNSLVFFILTFNEELKDIILFKKHFNGLKELLQVYIIALVQIYRFIVIIAHFSNPFSIIRIIEIYKNKMERVSTSLLSKSFLYIFFDIFALIPGYFFILLLPPVFISTNINICKRIHNKEIDKKGEYFYPEYNIIKNQIINDILKVLIYIIAIILTILSAPFIWRLKKSIKILIELFKTNNYKKFFENYLDNIAKGINQIINIGIIISIYFIGFILFIITIPFIWRFNKSIKIFMVLFKTNDYKKFFYDYFDNIIKGINQIIKVGIIIFMYSIRFILFIITIPFIWRLNKSIKIFIELCKTNDYKKFFDDYLDNIVKGINQIINVGIIIFMYSIRFILFIITIPFIWRLNKSIKIFIELFKTNEYKKFFIKYLNNLIDCLIETILSIPAILNHISPIHLKALYDCYYSNKIKEKKERKYLYISLNIFIEKWLDILIFIISMPRLIAINFYIYLIRKKCSINIFHLLFNNENLIKNQSNRNNRYKVIKNLFLDILTSLVMKLQILLGILNPFFTLKIIKSIYFYFIASKNQIQLDFTDIELKFISKSCKIIFDLLFFNFIYLPISLILNSLAL